MASPWMSRPGATGNWVRFARKGPNASDITPLKPSVSGRFRLASWHRPKPRFYRLDTLCGKAPKFRRFCWRKNVGKGESHGPKSVKPSAPCISLLWDDAASFCGFLTIAWLEPQAVRSIRGEPSTFACRQSCASPPYLAIPQTLRDRQVGQNELLVSTPLTPSPPFHFCSARVCFSHRIAKDSSHYPDILSLRQHCPSLASVSGIDTSRRTRQPPGARRAWTCGERAVITLCRGFDHPSVDQREPL